MRSVEYGAISVVPVIPNGDLEPRGHDTFQHLITRTLQRQTGRKAYDLLNGAIFNYQGSDDL